MKQMFLVVYKPGEAWPPGKTLNELPLQAHGKHMLSLFSTEKLLQAGPFTDDTGGAAILLAESLQDAKAITQQDPAVIEKLFDFDIHPWEWINWDKIVSSKKS